MHPSRLSELTHGCIDNRKAGAALLPSCQSCSVLDGVRIAHRGVVGVVVIVECVRVVEHHIGIELSPGELLAIGLLPA